MAFLTIASCCLFSKRASLAEVRRLSGTGGLSVNEHHKEASGSLVRSGVSNSRAVHEAASGMQRTDGQGCAGSGGDVSVDRLSDCLRCFSVGEVSDSVEQEALVAAAEERFLVC
jgi:hypothetical protein